MWRRVVKGNIVECEAPNCENEAEVVVDCHVWWDNAHAMCRECADWQLGRLTCPWHGDEEGCEMTVEELA